MNSLTGIPWSAAVVLISHRSVRESLHEMAYLTNLQNSIEADAQVKIGRIKEDFEARLVVTIEEEIVTIAVQPVSKRDPYHRRKDVN
ncbi:hypothetical protein GC163_04015 [bacterium]|nr:hypothetical protein [bacterium]